MVLYVAFVFSDSYAYGCAHFSYTGLLIINLERAAVIIPLIISSSALRNTLATHAGTYSLIAVVNALMAQCIMDTTKKYSQ